MAGGAGWGIKIIFSNNPFVLIQVQFVLVTIIGDPVLGFVKDFFLRMIRAEMAFPTVLRLTSLIFRERVA